MEKMRRRTFEQHALMRRYSTRKNEGDTGLHWDAVGRSSRCNYDCKVREKLRTDERKWYQRMLHKDRDKRKAGKTVWKFENRFCASMWKYRRISSRKSLGERGERNCHPKIPTLFSDYTASFSLPLTSLLRVCFFSLPSRHSRVQFTRRWPLSPLRSSHLSHLFNRCFDRLTNFLL